jgi:hypothetical protein
MKQIILILQASAILLILTENFASCGQNQGNEKKSIEEKDSVKIPLTEYSLTDTNCQWANLIYDGKVIVINSKTELGRYVTCTEDNYPEINFAEQTLLLACGAATNGIQDLSSKFFFKRSKYILEIEIALNDATVVEGWKIALITDKLNDRSSIELKTTTIKN